MAIEQELSFEQAMEQLEDIVRKLEEGNVPLEEAISIYKKGMELSKLCHDKLQDAEEQVAKLMTEEGEREFRIQEEE
ncbi:MULTISPECIES: exodeoxyribonuclease VII small subunit [Bacillus]|jgi:exodeoxyribonuclease VII small subunit|uniref:Exodeoxyribonuclease 7 small subunit n=1 Tax=Bacillus smithii 7_3_47FAA TaxID=665952 RepID=G9QPJ8_9BACI|nr:exodeoxyribonuclease VII small subunit [Bacillus smithii]AKP47745.1 Exodeoxyribonuclease VII small subunit [Bacillus smithii]EHL73639.1 exodeoxyribonuclease VII, small subunit [Bacillus smithii 7_3_47FAA]MED0659211.1 exodeoxyribonuclease VII small subunit [Bacillus smithii]MED1418901.1 exodeoxyribonuclease VII small subunit [Bacillus smithii]MED1455157.1 exodeoxyribonuclease VII small subunit [Bacillus smithii]